MELGIFLKYPDGIMLVITIHTIKWEYKRPVEKIVILSTE